MQVVGIPGGINLSIIEMKVFPIGNRFVRFENLKDRSIVIQNV